MKLLIFTCMLLAVTYGFGQETAKVGKLNVLTTERGQAGTVAENSGQRTVGKVHVNELITCGTWIEVEEDGRVTRLIPDNLKDAFKVDGAMIQFEYKLIENKSSTVCVGSSSVHLDNVSMMPSR